MARTKIKEVAIGTYSDYYLRLYYEENNVSNANNTSSVTISLYGYTERAAANCSFNNYGTNSISVVVDGTTSTLSNQNIDTSKWRTEHLLHSYTKTITHGSDGSKSITVSGSINYQGGGTSLTAGTYSTGNVTQSLTTIARASTVGTVSNTNITSTSGNVTINISKKNSAYYDQIVTTGAISKTINIGTASSGTISWAGLLAAMPSTTSATLNITVKTYSNSGYSTLIGSNPGKATITIDKDKIKPSISFGAISVNASGLSGKLVAGVSTAKATWTVTNATGASVSKVVVTGSNCSIASGASSTSTSGTPVTAQLPSRTSDYTITLTATVTDSRGATASTATSGATVYGYAPPNLTFNAYRVASSSATAADPTGAYVYTTFSVSAGASVGGSNSASISSKTPSSITNGGHYALATNATKAFTVVAKDTVGNTTSKTINIGTALIPFDLYSNAAGTSVGVGFGRMAEAGTVISALPVETSDGAKIWAGQDADNFENQIGARSSGGLVYLFSATDGRRGIYLPAAGSVEAKYLIYVDTAGQVHLGDGVPVYTSGDQTVSGTKIFTNNPNIRLTGNYPELTFQGRSATTTGRNGTLTLYAQENTVRFYFNEYHISNGVQNTYVDTYNLPESGTDNASHSYKFLTTKSAVAVDQGGTGATSAASARNNLQIWNTRLKASVGTTEVLITSDWSGYSTFIIAGIPGNSYYSSTAVPKVSIRDYSQYKWQINDETNYIGVTFRVSGTALYAKVSGSTTSGKTVDIYGLYGA